MSIFGWNPFDLPDWGDMCNVILGPMKDLMLIGGFSSGLMTFMMVYHRKAIASGVVSAGRFAGSAIKEGAPLLLL